MTQINGHYWHPLWVSLLQGAGAGIKPHVTEVVQGDHGWALSDWYQLLDRSTGGPYLVVIVNQRPSDTVGCSLRLVADGVNIHERALQPAGANFLVGTPFDTQWPYHTPAVWCHTGFEIWGLRTTGITYMEYVYYKIEWQEV
jgi:hypothetical protein